MNNNDILRRLRYSLDYSDTQVAKIIANIQGKPDAARVSRWLKREDYESLSNRDLCQFLDGLIIKKRGLRPDGTIPKPQEHLSINEILKKLRIALNLREEGMLEVFERAEFTVTKAELGSFFRKKGQRNYSACPEQVLRKFIHGLTQEG